MSEYEFAQRPNGDSGHAGDFDAVTRYRLHALGLDPERLRWLPPRARADTLYRHFVDRVPYENLSGNRTCADRPAEPSAWPRGTDRFLRDHKRCGLGGSSFALSYALRDLLSGLGLSAHYTLGKNLVTGQAHAAVVVYLDGEALLYDPGLLTHGPLPVCPGGRLEDALGTVFLDPRRGRQLLVLLRMRCAQVARPIYAIVPAPAPPPLFRRAWVASFQRGRLHPLRMARRVGNQVRRYAERPRRLELINPEGRETRDLGPAPVDALHELFGIDPDCLRTWFGGGGATTTTTT